MGVFSLWDYYVKEEIKMSMEKLKQYEAYTVSKSLCGLYLKEGEKGRLYQFCIKYEIPICYPELFADDTHYYLWGISSKEIGLVGTIIMNYLSQNNGTIFQSLDELEGFYKMEIKC